MGSQETVSKQIFARITRKRKGSVFTPKDFLDFAGHETVRQVLARLTGTGKIRRLLRGVYGYPQYSPLLKDLSAPDPNAIAGAIARTHGWTIVLSHRTNKETTKLSPSSAAVVQALKALGQRRVDKGVVEKLMGSLRPEELSRAVREARYATSWVYEITKRLATRGSGDHARDGAPPRAQPGGAACAGHR